MWSSMVSWPVSVLPIFLQPPLRMSLIIRTKTKPSALSLEYMKTTYIKVILGKVTVDNPLCGSCHQFVLDKKKTHVDA
jgi:hypothetical protein